MNNELISDENDLSLSVEDIEYIRYSFLQNDANQLVPLQLLHYILSVEEILTIIALKIKYRYYQILIQ